MQSTLGRTSSPSTPTQCNPPTTVTYTHFTCQHTTGLTGPDASLGSSASTTGTTFSPRLPTHLQHLHRLRWLPQSQLTPRQKSSVRTVIRNSQRLTSVAILYSFGLTQLSSARHQQTMSMHCRTIEYFEFSSFLMHVTTLYSCFSVFAISEIFGC